MAAFDILRQRMDSGKLRIESWSDPEAENDRKYSDIVKISKMGLVKFG